MDSERRDLQCHTTPLPLAEAQQLPTKAHYPAQGIAIPSPRARLVWVDSAEKNTIFELVKWSVDFHMISNMLSFILMFHYCP